MGSAAVPEVRRALPAARCHTPPGYTCLVQAEAGSAASAVLGLLGPLGRGQRRVQHPVLALVQRRVRLLARHAVLAAAVVLRS